MQILRAKITQVLQKGETALNLRDQDLKRLLPEIGQLTKLTRLYLYDNQLRELPPEIGQLSNLGELYLSNNQLRKLPPEIGQLSNLRKLYLKNNQLRELPPEIGKLTDLEELALEGNPLDLLPPEIGSRESNAIINFYRQLWKKTQSLNEAKMLLVGQGSVGKTSLVNRLVNNTFNSHENKTEGINIQKWTVKTNRQKIQLNIWDFGGQEIMHATHQFFLTKRSIYLLVLDSRLEEEENRLEYWLKMIQTFGGESPVIVVGNKIDQHPLDLDRKGLQNKYPTLKAFVETSCQSGEGIEELKYLIEKEVAKLKHVSDELPLAWFNVKIQLEKMKSDYIPYTQYQNLCQKKEIYDELSQRTLVGFLHDLGVVLNFQDDPRLYDTHVLNPKWVTNGVYQIINDNKVMTQDNGVLKRLELNRILSLKKYPQDKHLFIIDMMRKFELCFDIVSDEKFLIPDLLPKEEKYTGEWKEALTFEYHYNVLPNSIISRFIVRINELIHESTYWRNGVVISYEDNLALIKADREDKKILIRIKGNEKTRHNLLAIIRSQLDAIHKTLQRIELKEKIIISHHAESDTVDYRYLLALEKMGEQEYIPPKIMQKLKLKTILDNIEPDRDDTALQKEYADQEIQINELLKDLQNQGISLEKAQEQAASKLANEVRNNPKALVKFIKWIQFIKDVAAKTAVTEATKGVIKLTLMILKIPLP